MKNKHFNHKCYGLYETSAITASTCFDPKYVEDPALKSVCLGPEVLKNNYGGFTSIALLNFQVVDVILELHKV